MALTVVQTTSARSGANSDHIDVTIGATVAGNTLVVIGREDNGAHHIVAASDLTNPFTQFTGAAVDGTGTRSGVNMDAWRLFNCAGAKTTIRVTWESSGPFVKDVWVWEVSGFITPAEDGANNTVTEGTASGTTMTGGAITTTAPIGFLAAVCTPANDVDENPKTGNEFTSGGDNLNGNGGISLISSSAATHTPVWDSTTASDKFNAITVAIKETASATAPFVPNGAVPPPRGPEFPTPLRTWAQGMPRELVGQDVQFAGPGQFRAYDWPLPPRLPSPVPQFRSPLNLLMNTLAPVVAQAPVVPIPTPLPPRVPQLGLTFTSWFVIDDNAPFVPVQWPAPQRPIYPVALRTSTARTPALDGVAPMPFSQSDWPVPRRPEHPIAARTWTDHRELMLVDTFPFSQTDWPLPRPPRYPMQLRTWIQSLVTGTLGLPIVVPVGRLLEWPLPPRRPPVGKSFTSWFVIDDNAPFVPVQWPAPQRPVYPVTLRTWIQALLTGTLGLPVVVPPEPPAPATALGHRAGLIVDGGGQRHGPIVPGAGKRSW